MGIPGKAFGSGRRLISQRLTPHWSRVKKPGLWPYHTRSVADPTEGYGRSPWILLYYCGKRGLRPALPPISPPPRAPPMRDSQLSQWEGSLLPVYSDGLRVYNSLANFPFLTTERSSPVFSELGCGFAIAYLFGVEILCCHWINSFFAGRITSSFIFQVNFTCWSDMGYREDRRLVNRQVHGLTAFFPTWGLKSKVSPGVWTLWFVCELFELCSGPF